MSKVLMNFAEHANLPKSKLSKDEFEFVKPLVDSAYLVRRMKKSKFSENLVFEGLLDRHVLDKLYNIVVKILKLIKQKSHAQRDRDHPSYAEAESELFDLSNQFYELSTPTEFAFDKFEGLQNKN